MLQFCYSNEPPRINVWVEDWMERRTSMDVLIAHALTDRISMPTTAFMEATLTLSLMPFTKVRGTSQNSSEIHPTPTATRYIDPPMVQYE